MDPQPHDPEPVDQYALTLPPWFPITAFFLGIGVGMIGIITGIVKMVYRVEIQCPDGTEFRADETDFSCYSHPDAGTGLAIAAGAVLATLIIVLLASIASQQVRPASRR